MNTISFNTANYVARQINYNMTGGWGQGDRSTSQYFEPIETFAERFEQYMQDVVSAGFNAIDMWTSILSPEWATDEHIQTAITLCQKYNLQTVSCDQSQVYHVVVCEFVKIERFLKTSFVVVLHV